MTNAQSMWALRNEIKKLKRMLKDSNQKNLDQEDTMNRMQAFLSEKTAEYGHQMTVKDKSVTEEIKRFDRSILLAQGKIANLENLVRQYEKRLARMADRLTDLATERNDLYVRLKEAHRTIDFLERKEEELRILRTTLGERSLDD